MSVKKRCHECDLPIDECLCGVELAEDLLEPVVSDLMAGDEERDYGPSL